MRYSRPDESFMFGTGSGTVATGYNANWIVDGLPGRPVKNTTSLSIAITGPASRTVGIVSVINHTVDAGLAITFSGGVSATCTPDNLPDGTVPLNPWAAVTPASASSCTVAVSGNSVDVVIGEVWVGQSRTIPDLIREPSINGGQTLPWEGEFSSVAPYDPGIEQRRLSADVVVDDATMADIADWYRSTRSGTRPSLIVPIETNNDAWLVTFQYTAKPANKNRHKVSFDFVELPRYRWS
jgi:hypothetical protein